jgi:hypothetical protein
MRRFWLGAAAAILLLGQGLTQERTKITPAAHLVPLDSPANKIRDTAKWSESRQQCFRSARLAMDWLRRTNKPDGRFVYGFLPALCVPMEGDSYVAQAGAAFALARAGRFFSDEAATATARQALLTLLLETAVDPKLPQERFTAAPPAVLERLAGNGALLLAIHELATPGKDLLDQGEQLANYLRRQQRSDGSFDTASSEAVGLALGGISRGYKHRPAPWKIEMVRKARDLYLAQWQKNKDLLLVVSHTAAYAEAYLATKDSAYAEAVFACNDWLCGLQYSQAEPLRKHWDGGFPAWEQGRLQPGAPDIRSAACAECLAEACRVARAANDLPRYHRYGRAVEQCLQFLLQLQFDSGRTRHYVEEFRPAVTGAFFASHQDGNLRLDYTQHALSALVVYLENLVE